MKAIISYFPNEKAIGIASAALTRSHYGHLNEVHLSITPTESTSAFDRCCHYAFFGGAIGVIITFFICIIPGLESLSATLPFTGLLTGTVIGAVTGSLLDIVTYNKMPGCTRLYVTVSQDTYYDILKLLRKKGASASFLEKGGTNGL